MALTQNIPKEPPRAFELKGRMMAFSVLRVLTPDLRFLAQQLDAKIATAPHLFQNFPVLLDFEALPHEVQEAFDIGRLDRLLRERSFVPVGLCNAGDVLRGVAGGVGIGVISAGLAAPARQPAKEAAAPAPRLTNLLIKDPIRSGQQVYARGGDLTVLATVSPGAEIMADGNIHIYGSLRGRALAGVRGNAEARIFCQDLDAELVSIAGRYQISEKFKETSRKRPVQIFLNGERLVIEPL
jgi:septum site-determining protein MinC